VTTLNHTRRVLCKESDQPALPLFQLRRAAVQVLFMFGNVIKTLFAKMMSSHYYKASQFEKLQDALKKARRAWLRCRVHSCSITKLAGCAHRDLFAASVTVLVPFQVTAFNLASRRNAGTEMTRLWRLTGVLLSGSVPPARAPIGPGAGGSGALDVQPEGRRQQGAAGQALLSGTAW